MYKLFIYIYFIYIYFNVNHNITGHNVHLAATQKLTTKFFVYKEECKHPEGTYQYVGSTFAHRWANTKSKCNKITSNGRTKPGTVLEKLMSKGYSMYNGPELTNVKICLLEQFNTWGKKLRTANHGRGTGRQCSQCIV